MSTNQLWVTHLKNFNALLNDLNAAGLSRPSYVRVLSVIRNTILNMIDNENK